MRALGREAGGEAAEKWLLCALLCAKHCTVL